MVDSPFKVLRFDRFTLDPARYVVLRNDQGGDQELALRRQSFEVLRYLAEHQGEVVSAGDLVEALWTSRPARPEDSVFQCIKDIRRALGSDARWIVRAVPGRGYTFMAEVAAVETAPPAAAPSPEPGSDAQPTPAEAPRGEAAPAAESRSKPGILPLQWQRALIAAGLLIAVLTAAGGWLVWQRLYPAPPAALTMMAAPTLAVLPFAFADDQQVLRGEALALTDQVESEIGHHILGSMISLRPAVDFGEWTDTKTIGRRLGARYLLLGELRREGSNRSGSMRLIESESGRELWVYPFRYAPGEESLRAVRMGGGTSLLVVVAESRRPLPAAPQAGHYAIVGYVNMGNHRKSGAANEALSLFEKALALDRDLVPALLGYSRQQMVLSHTEPPDRRAERLGKAQDAVERAIKLAPLSAPAYHFHALVLRARGDPVAAIASSRHALTLNPNYPDAHAHLAQSKIDAGLAHEAIPHIEEALRLTPVHRWHSMWCLWAGQAAVHTGNYDLAVEWLQKATYAKVPRRLFLKGWLAVAHAGLGREAEARALLAEYAREGGKLTIAGWRRRHPRGGSVLARQRERIEGLLRRLGVPEGKVQTGAVQ